MTTAFELDWQTPYINGTPSDESTVAAQSKYLMWFLPAFLRGHIGGSVSGLWTEEGSSDGVTAGMDGVNRWGSAFDATKIVRGASSSARSWRVLKSPVGLGPFYVLFDYNTSNDYQINVTVSKSPFSGGTPTTTGLPTAANSWTYSAQQIVPQTIASQKIFARLSTTGQWHIQFGTVSTLKYTFGLSFFALAETKTGDDHNGWTYCEYSSGGVWLVNAIGSSTPTLIKGRSKDGTVAVSAKLPRLRDSSVLDALDEVGNVDAVDSAMNEEPAYLFVYTAAHKSKRGRLQDILHAPTTASSATVDPLTGPPYDSHVVGTVWMPYKSSSTPVL